MTVSERSRVAFTPPRWGSAHRGQQEGTYQARATLRFCGPTSFSSGEWFGLESDWPCGESVGSAPGHGLFIQPSATVFPTGRAQRMNCDAWLVKTSPDQPQGRWRELTVPS